MHVNRVVCWEVRECGVGGEGREGKTLERGYTHKPAKHGRIESVPKWCDVIIVNA